MEPAEALLGPHEPNAAYLAAAPGKAYGLYLPAGGTVSVDVSAVKGALQLRWIDIDTGEWGPQESIDGGREAKLRAPGTGNWAAAITPREP